MIVLLVLSALVMFVSGIWFLVVAFRQHVGWGFAVLFIPLANLVFLVKHWAAARASFLVNLVATLVFSGAAMNVGMLALHSKPEQFLAGNPPAQDFDPDELQARLREQLSKTESDDTAAYPAPTPAPASKPATTPGSASSPDTQAEQATTRPAATPSASSGSAPEQTVRLVPVRLAEARQHVGEKLRVTTAGNLTREATLKQVSGNKLLFERRLYSGSVSFEMYNHDIKKLERWARD